MFMTFLLVEIYMYGSYSMFQRLYDRNKLRGIEDQNRKKYLLS